ncbi:MAG: hypothetical protein ABIP39_11920 [Polyangiaceae bacterium]
MTRYIVLLSFLAASSCGRGSERAQSSSGSVVSRVATFGIVRVRPTNSPDDTFLEALHVRVTITDDGETPWSFDTREQRAVLPGGDQSSAAYASTATSSPPVVAIPPGETRTVDLFFPLPSAMQASAKAVPFDMISRVRVGDRIVTQRTPFARVAVAPYDPQFANGGYWYDPGYPSSTFVGVGALPPLFVGHPVYIARAPR